MPQIMKSSLVLALLLLAFLGILTVAGCGDGNSQSHYDPDQGRHPADWLPSGHIQPALQHLDTCEDCHGSNVNGQFTSLSSGGISKVACSQCHVLAHSAAGNPSVHPLDWDNLVYVRHAAYVGWHGTNRGTTNCASTFCHGNNLEGGGGPSCSSCHIGGPTQIHPWDISPNHSIDQQIDLAATPVPLHGQFVFTHGTTSTCRNAVCHGAQLQGVLLSGPACSICHGSAVANFPQ
jgi:hypothetical protein